MAKCWVCAVPDRYDLMERVEVLSSLRISSDWCARVNRRALSDADLSRLAAGEVWLVAMLIEFDRVLARNANVDLAISDNAPKLGAVNREADSVVDGFLQAFIEVDTSVG